ncbi:Arc family DNA-binding protein [Burkholderia sp. Ed8]|uniref:FitA-like ribbon-helix-helix domain-containing protein n=1 Tax=Burkholderia sp. Ed8 TaxID=3112957 RepID=UPI00345D8C24
MPVLTVRNLPDEVHRALRIRAARRGRSTEAEVRDILEQAVLPEGRLKLGTLLAEFGPEAGDGDFGIQRDKAPAAPMSFE